MQLAPELVAVGVIAAVVLIGLWLRRARNSRTRNVGRPVAGGPANLRFTCAGCSQQFTHSRRTLGTWRKGTRSFYCNACHTKWRGAQPMLVKPQKRGVPAASPKPPAAASKPMSSASVSRSHSNAKPERSGSGCLGIVLIGIAAPTALVVALLHYA